MENNIIGERIAKARKKSNLSQAQLAEQLFISPQAVGKWERGESIPDILTMIKLAKILETDLNYFSGHSVSNEEIPLIKNKETENSVINENMKPDQERDLLTNFNGSALADTDFAGVIAPKRKFSGTDLHAANFSAADLSGSSFIGSDAREANFDETNLSDCSFTAIDLTNASFNKTILVRAKISASDLSMAKFKDVNFVDVKFSASDLKKTIFENCSFKGVDFKSSDLDGLCFDGLIFTDVRFDNASLKDTSFKGAIIKNVSFRPSFALTNRYFKTLKTISFNGATMDKLTYAALKSVGVDLSGVKNA